MSIRWRIQKALLIGVLVQTSKWPSFHVMLSTAIINNAAEKDVHRSRRTEDLTCLVFQEQAHNQCDQATLTLPDTGTSWFPPLCPLRRTRTPAPNEIQISWPSPEQQRQCVQSKSPLYQTLDLAAHKDTACLGGLRVNTAFIHSNHHSFQDQAFGRC